MAIGHSALLVHVNVTIPKQNTNCWRKSTGQAGSGPFFRLNLKNGPNSECHSLHRSRLTLWTLCAALFLSHFMFCQRVQHRQFLASPFYLSKSFDGELLLLLPFKSTLLLTITSKLDGEPSKVFPHSSKQILI